MKKHNLAKGLATLLTAGLIAFTVAVPAQAEEESAMARGGKLYDKWYKVIDVDAPKKSHSAYPSGKKYAKKPKDNWRCKECHGWDYKGVNGAYASGKHSTGIKGINGMIGADLDKIVEILEDSTHGYGGKMEHDDLHDLAIFVSKGQVDMSKYIDYATKSAKGGNADQGAAYFNTICANCHRKDGSRPKDMGKSLGSQMGNPQEVMHKILNGHPGEKMPALRAMDRQVIVDILAHIKTLPEKKL